MGGVKFNSYTIDKNFTSLMNMKYEELLLIFARKNHFMPPLLRHLAGLLALGLIFGFILVSDWFMLDLLVKCVLVLGQIITSAIGLDEQVQMVDIILNFDMWLNLDG